MELILVVVISAGMAENSQNGVSRSLISNSMIALTMSARVASSALRLSDVTLRLSGGNSLAKIDHIMVFASLISSDTINN